MGASILRKTRFIQIPSCSFFHWTLVIILNISEADVERRFDQAKILDDRGEREDDKNLEIFKTRVQEFHEKTLPVIQHYNSLGLLIEVNGDQSREAVFNEIVEKLYQKASLSHV